MIMTARVRVGWIEAPLPPEEAPAEEAAVEVRE